MSYNQQKQSFAKITTVTSKALNETFKVSYKIAVSDKSWNKAWWMIRENNFDNFHMQVKL